MFVYLICGFYKLPTFLTDMQRYGTGDVWKESGNLMSNVNCIFGWLSMTEVLLLAVAVVLFCEKVAASLLPEAMLDHRYYM